MDLPTYSNIWRIEKRLYKLYDFRLPMPVPMTTAGIFIGAVLVWWVLLSVVQMPFTFGNGWHLVIWVVPPGLVALAATRPVIEQKLLGELLWSQWVFAREGRVYVRLRPESEPVHTGVHALVWRHKDQAPDRHHDDAVFTPRTLPTRSLAAALATTPAPADPAPADA